MNSIPKSTHKILGMMVHARNPNAQKVETEGFLGHYGLTDKLQVC